MKIILIITLCFSVAVVNAQTDSVKVPAEVLPFVEKNAKPIALESADLNGDKLKDYILVLQRENPSEKDEYDYPENERPLLILLRGKDKKLSEAKRNEKIVMCSQCGGVMGDPFMGVEAGEKTFTVNHYGGSGWRWSESYKFNYSRIDDTWQLVRIEKENFHAGDPNKTMKRKVLTPPKDYGKIDINDFDPSDFEEKPEEETSSTNLITTDSAGKIKLGMTVADAREAVKPMILSRTTDGEGVALIAVSDGNKSVMTLYAGEEDSDAKIDDKAKIEQIEIWDKSFRTGEGAQVGMKLGEMEKKYGKVREIMLSEIEAREFAWFADQPDGLGFRLMNENGMAGVYPNGKNVTGKYANGAYIYSILVTGAGETAQNKDFQTIDVKTFNEKIEKAAAANEQWVKMPTQIVARSIDPFSEVRSRSIEMTAPTADDADSLVVTVIDDGFLDDSVRGEKLRFELQRNENGVWRFVKGEKSWRCQTGRGHENFSAELCL